MGFKISLPVNDILYIFLWFTEYSVAQQVVHVHHLQVIQIDYIRQLYLHIKLASKVMHKLYIDFYVNFMQDFWR